MGLKFGCRSGQLPIFELELADEWQLGGLLIQIWVEGYNLEPLARQLEYLSSVSFLTRFFFSTTKGCLYLVVGLVRLTK